jgi:hypothetical protein
MSTPSSPNGILPVTATATSSFPPTSVSNDSIHPASDNNNSNDIHPLVPEHMPQAGVSPSLSSVASDTLSITDIIDIRQQQANIINTDSIMDTTITTNTTNDTFSNSNDDKKDYQPNGARPRRRRNKKKEKDTVLVVNEDERRSVDLYLDIVLEKVESTQKYVDSIMKANTDISKKKQILQRLLKDIAQYRVYEGFLEEPIWYDDTPDGPDPFHAKWCNAFDKWNDIYLRMKSIINGN